ncbi:MAG: hypothetical protein JW944_12560 [Deltaproteobacteria bacterium]|nr:hypothetical protein [Deltaproteobacteria bacterium]
MTPLKKYAVVFFLISLLTLILSSCSGVPVLNVNYRSPVKAAPLEGIKVFLEIRDSRTDREIFGEGAKEDFLNAPETISLSVAEGNEKGFKIGLFPIDELMQEIFRERLRCLGLEVNTVLNNKGDEPVVVIDLQTFKLDLTKGTVKRTWTAGMAYSVEISDKGKVLAGTRISGQSEKMKIIRRKEADSLMSDLVTDLANRLDAAALFRQAGLI